MPKYKLADGQIVDEQQLQNFAISNNLSLDELLAKNPEIEIIEEDSFQIHVDGL